MWKSVCHFGKYDTWSLKMRWEIWQLQFAPAGLALWIGWHLLWNGTRDTGKPACNNLWSGWKNWRIVMAHRTISLTKCYITDKSLSSWYQVKLTPDLKEHRFKGEGEDILQRTVTPGECWVHYLQSETKRVSIEWRHSSSSKPDKFRTISSPWKLMLTAFWDSKGQILKRYMPRAITTKSETICDLFENHLKLAVSSKHRRFSILVCCYSTIMHGLTQQIQQLNELRICI